MPGQVFYNATRRLVLQGVDGVVFVADSQREMANSNMESLKNLIDNLSSYGKKLEELPFIIQYNKRDLKNVMTTKELDETLNILHVPTHEAVAPTGKGVTETLVAISRLVFTHLRKTLLMPGEMASQEGLMELADDKIQKTFGQQEAEPLEEISDVEEIKEPAAGPEVELELETTSLKERGGAAGAADGIRGAGRDRGGAPRGDARAARGRGAAAPTVSVKATGGELAFLKFEAPFVSPEGHAILPALFLDGAGNSVRVRIRVTIDEERP